MWETGIKKRREDQLRKRLVDNIVYSVPHLVPLLIPGYPAAEKQDEKRVICCFIRAYDQSDLKNQSKGFSVLIQALLLIVTASGVQRQTGKASKSTTSSKAVASEGRKKHPSSLYSIQRVLNSATSHNLHHYYHQDEDVQS